MEIDKHSMEVARPPAPTDTVIISSNSCQMHQFSLQAIKKQQSPRKPPCSPGKKSQQPQIPSEYSPSPTKKRSSSEKENEFSLSLIPQSPFMPELNLLSLTRNESDSSIKVANQECYRLSSSSCENKENGKSKKLSRSFQSSNLKGSQSPKLMSPIKKNSKYSSFLTPESLKFKVFTPVLTEKKRRITTSDRYCKRISLFEAINNKPSITPDTCSSFKDQSTRIEDSTTFGEITPIKSEDILKEEFPEDSFTSPVNTIKVMNSPEERTMTPESDQLQTPELSDRKVKKVPKAPKKLINDLSSPDSHFFSLSSSSEELVSDVSFSEDAREKIVENERRNQTSDKEMQTDARFEEVISLLNDEDVIDGLKIAKKFKEIMRIINKL